MYYLPELRRTVPHNVPSNIHIVLNFLLGNWRCWNDVCSCDFILTTIGSMIKVIFISLICNQETHAFTPITAASRTAGWSNSSVSSSAGATWFPLTLINSYFMIRYLKQNKFEYGFQDEAKDLYLSSANDEIPAFMIPNCDITGLKPSIRSDCIAGTLTLTLSFPSNPSLYWDISSRVLRSLRVWLRCNCRPQVLPQRSA